jgi:hypothetical protein
MKRQRKSKIRELYEKIPAGTRAILELGALGLTGFIVYRVGSQWYEKYQMQRDIKTFQNKTVEELNINYAEIAKEIYDALGAGYNAWNPKTWGDSYENEEKATLAVLKVPKPFIPRLEEEYRVKYSRNLRDDLQTFLDEYWYNVRHLFT